MHASGDLVRRHRSCTLGGTVSLLFLTRGEVDQWARVGLIDWVDPVAIGQPSSPH
jgi:hypothetical protein